MCTKNIFAALPFQTDDTATRRSSLISLWKNTARNLDCIHKTSPDALPKQKKTMPETSQLLEEDEEEKTKTCQTPERRNVTNGKRNSDLYAMTDLLNQQASHEKYHPLNDNFPRRPGTTQRGLSLAAMKALVRAGISLKAQDISLTDREAQLKARNQTLEEYAKEQWEKESTQKPSVENTPRNDGGYLPLAILMPRKHTATDGSIGDYINWPNPIPNQPIVNTYLQPIQAADRPAGMACSKAASVLLELSHNTPIESRIFHAEEATRAQTKIKKLVPIMIRTEQGDLVQVRSLSDDEKYKKGKLLNAAGLPALTIDNTLPTKELEKKPGDKPALPLCPPPLTGEETMPAMTLCYDPGRDDGQTKPATFFHPDIWNPAQRNLTTYRLCDWAWPPSSFGLPQRTQWMWNKQLLVSLDEKKIFMPLKHTKTTPLALKAREADF